MRRFIPLAVLVLALFGLSIYFAPVHADHESLQDDLVAYWRLDEVSGTRFDAVGNNDLTDNNTVGQAAGKIDEAAQFIDANNEYLSIADNADLSAGDRDFTIACWVYLEQTNGQWIIDKWQTAEMEYRLRYESGGSNLEWRVQNSAGTSTDNVQSGAVNQEEWIYAIMWHDSVNNEIAIQVNNGSVITKTHTNGVYDGGDDFEISTSGASTLEGRVDEVAFWARVLTEEERTLLWNDGDGLDILSTHDTPTPTPTPTTAPGTPTPSSVFTQTLASDHLLVVDTQVDFGELAVAATLITLLTLLVYLFVLRVRR